MAKQTVYISSTFVDLADYRAILLDTFNATLSNRFELKRIMEYMKEEDGKSSTDIEVCLKEVRACNLYLLILGNRKGSSPFRGGRETYTEMEYKTAFSHQKTIYRFGHKDVDHINDPYFRTFFDSGNGSSFKKNEYWDLASFKDIFQRSMLRFITEQVPSSRLWYYLMTSAIVLLGILGTLVTYDQTKDYLVTLLVPLLFICILLYLWKDIISPSNPFTAN